MSRHTLKNISTSSTGFTISAIIPVYNDVRHLEACLQALQRSTILPQIILVDDASTDETVAFIQQSGYKNYRMPKNSGPAAARNLGAAHADTDLLFFIDADVCVHTDTVAKILAYFEQHLNVHAIIGSYDDEPSEANFISQYKNLSHHIIHQLSKKEAKTFWGACGAIRRQVFAQLNGFNEEYSRPCIEDIELGYRLVAAGYKIHLLKDVLIKHAKKWTFRTMVRTDFYDRAIPWAHLLKKQVFQHNDLNIALSQKFSAVGSLFLIASLMFSFVNAFFMIPAAIFMIIILLLNKSYYALFIQKRSWLFAVRVFPLHLLYYVYSVLGYIIAQVTRHEKYLHHRSRTGRLGSGLRVEQ